MPGQRPSPSGQYRKPSEVPSRTEISTSRSFISWSSPLCCRRSTDLDSMLRSRRRTLTSPLQSDRSSHGMLHLPAGSGRLQIRRLQLEIPLRRTIRVVDQHQMRIVLQALRLILHRLPVLFDELRKHKFQQRRSKRHPAENVPASHHINTAMAARDGRHGGQAGKPILPCPNGFEAQVGQNKIDGGRDRIRVRVKPQQLVRRAVRAGHVRAHAEAHGDRLEILLLLVNAVPAAPPPCLMHKRSVRRVHEPDDAVVHVAWQRSGQVRDLVLSAKSWNPRSGRRRLRHLSETGSGRRRLGNKYPNVVVVLLTRVTPRIDPVHFQFLIGSQRRNDLALATVGIKLPSVVAALQTLTVEPPARKRHPPMRAGVSQGKRLSLAIAPDDQRRLQQHSLMQTVPGNLRTGQCTIPEAEQHQGVRRLAESHLQFTHEESQAYYMKQTLWRTSVPARHNSRFERNLSENNRWAGMPALHTG